MAETGLDLAHVPYRGGSAVIPDLIAGNVVFAFATVSTSAQLVRDGRLKALAVTYQQRLPSMPEVPTTREIGLPRVDVDEWNMLFGVAGTPAPVLARLSAATLHALAQPNVRERYAAFGGLTIGSGVEQAAAFIAERRAAMGRLIREANIRVE